VLGASGCAGVSGMISGEDCGGVTNSAGRDKARAAASLEGVNLSTRGCLVVAVCPLGSDPSVPSVEDSILSFIDSEHSSTDLDFPHNPCNVDDNGMDFFSAFRFLDFLTTRSSSSVAPGAERGVDCCFAEAISVILGALRS